MHRAISAVAIAALVLTGCSAEASDTAEKADMDKVTSEVVWQDHRESFGFEEYDHDRFAFVTRITNNDDVPATVDLITEASNEGYGGTYDVPTIPPGESFDYYIIGSDVDGLTVSTTQTPQGERSILPMSDTEMSSVEHTYDDHVIYTIRSTVNYNGNLEAAEHGVQQQVVLYNDHGDIVGGKDGHPGEELGVPAGEAGQVEQTLKGAEATEEATTAQHTVWR